MYVAAVEAASVMEVEKHGSAAQERLEVAVERRRVKGAKLRQQLALAAGPFQQGTQRTHVRHRFLGSPRHPCA
jgi:hypothetical protein